MVAKLGRSVLRPYMIVLRVCKYLEINTWGFLGESDSGTFALSEMQFDVWEGA